MGGKKRTRQETTDPAELRKRQLEREKREKRRLSATEEAVVEGIREFLRNCTARETDAICAIIRLADMMADGNGGGATFFTESDRKVIDIYLNTGYSLYKDYVGEAGIRRHRREQAKKLMEDARRFLSFDQYCKVNNAVGDIAVSESDIKKFAERRKAATGKDDGQE